MDKDIRDDIELMMHKIKAAVWNHDGWYHWNTEASDIVWEKMREIIKQYCDPKKGMYIDNIIRG
jgi:hypothetical protein